jgi:hypothetical protein
MTNYEVAATNAAYQILDHVVKFSNKLGYGPAGQQFENNVLQVGWVKVHGGFRIMLSFEVKLRGDDMKVGMNYHVLDQQNAGVKRELEQLANEYFDEAAVRNWKQEAGE